MIGEAHTGTTHVRSSGDDEGAGAAGEPMLLQRDEYTVRYSSVENGREHWNVSVALFSTVELTPPHAMDQIWRSLPTVQQHALQERTRGTTGGRVGGSVYDDVQSLAAASLPRVPRFIPREVRRRSAVGSPIHQKVRHKPDDSLDSTFPRTSRFFLRFSGETTVSPLTPPRHHTQAATRRSPASSRRQARALLRAELVPSSTATDDYAIDARRRAQAAPTASATIWTIEWGAPGGRATPSPRARQRDAYERSGSLGWSFDAWKFDEETETEHAPGRPRAAVAAGGVTSGAGCPTSR